MRKRDNNWYQFRWDCPLHDTIDGNIHRRNRHTCSRGKRPSYDLLACQKSGCPRIKEFIEKVKRGEV